MPPSITPSSQPFIPALKTETFMIMDAIELAIALIRKDDSGQAAWLVKRGIDPPELSFIMANRLEGESMRESVTREVAWELGLDRSRDLLVSNMAQLNLEFVGPLPDRQHSTLNRVSFFNVFIYRKRQIEVFSEHQDFRWVNASEICEGLSQDGIPFSPLATRLIVDAGVIQTWESN